MKFLKAAVIAILFLIPLSVANAEDPGDGIEDKNYIELKADEEGKVVVEEGLIGNELTNILNDAEPDQSFNIQNKARATVFNTYDFANGYFDSVGSTGYKITGTGKSSHFILDNINNQATGGGTYIITLTNPAKIKGYYWSGVSYYGPGSIDFYFQGNLLESRSLASNTVNTGYFDLSKSITVDKVEISLKAHATSYINEFELFESEEINYESVTSLQVDPLERAANLSFINPNNNHFRGSEIYLNDVLVFEKSNAQTFNFTKLEPSTNYTVIVRSYYSDGITVDSVSEFRTLDDVTPPAEVTDIKINQQGKEQILLSYTMPNDLDFSHVIIYKNGVKIEDHYKKTTYSDDDIKLNETYEYKIVTVDLYGNKSVGITKKIKPSRAEVTNVKAIAKDYTKVELSWNNPLAEDFEKVVIYRKKENQNLFARVRIFFSADDGYDPLFETNGTMFKDLTVEAATTYEYKLTTLVAGVETEGVTTKVTTPQIHALDTEVETDEGSGDYTLRWSAPNIGRMKVLIDGVEYKIVPAADLQVTIPKSKIPTDVFGDPKLNKIQLIPISEAGEEGMPVSAGENGGGGIGGSKITDIFNVKDLVKAAMDLFLLVGPFVLLALAFLFSDKIMNLLKRVYHYYGYRKVRREYKEYCRQRGIPYKIESRKGVPYDD